MRLELITRLKLRIFAVLVATGLIATAMNACGDFRAKKLDSGAGDLSSEFGPITPFEISMNRQEVLPYEVRYSKLKHIVGVQDESVLQTLNSRRFELGAANFAEGIQPELSWTEKRAKIWMEGLRPVCSLQSLKEKYPFPTQAAQFLEKIYGRELKSDDQALISRIGSEAAVADQEKFEVLCLVSLSSAEFLSL